MTQTMHENPTNHSAAGQMALIYCGARLPVQVLRSAAGFYIGTADEQGPVSRESCEYFRTAEHAARALKSGQWTQRLEP